MQFGHAHGAAPLHTVEDLHGQGEDRVAAAAAVVHLREASRAAEGAPLQQTEHVSHGHHCLFAGPGEEDAAGGVLPDGDILRGHFRVQQVLDLLVINLQETDFKLHHLIC